jgi:DNA-directed RNA polymerase specialized sigma24 family protein
VTPEDDRLRPEAMSELDDVPFERLFEVWRTGGDLKAWNDRFGTIVAQVAARLRRRFGDQDLAESAAGSAVATLLRRVREGDPDSKLDRLDGPGALEGYLVLLAHTKVWKKLKDQWARRPCPEGLEPVDPGPAPDVSEADPDLIRDAVRVEMKVQLQRMLDRMNLLLGTPRQRATFALMYRSMYGIEQLTDAAIARRVGVTAKTVQRVRRQVEQHWPELEADGQRAVRALEAALRGQVEP